MQSEKDADDLGAGGGARCPICSKPAREQVCEHHLGSFDMTFPGEGEYGIGLGGGALYDVREIGEVFNVALLDYAKARIGGKSRTEAVPAWCKEDPGLKEYVGSFEDEDPDPSDYPDVPEDADVQGYANFLADQGLAHLIRAGLSSLLEGIGIRVMETRWEQDIPMVSSVYEEWWCQSPEDAAAKLANRLRQILDRRAKS